MSNIEDLADVFGAGIPMPEVVEVDEDEEAKKYYLSLMERVIKLKEAKYMEEEAIRSHEEAGTSVSLTLTDDSALEEEPELIDISKFLTVDKDKYTVPVFKASGVQKWTKILHHHERKLLDVAHNLRKISMYKDLTTELDQLKSDNQTVVYFKRLGKIKDKIQRQLAAKTLQIYDLEQAVFQKLGYLAFQLRDLSCVVDNATNGVWVQEPDDPVTKSIVSELGTNRIVLTKRFHFDAKMTEDLITILLSQNPDQRAIAKLNLSSKLPQDIFREVVAFTARTLEIVCSEALLTKQEILYLVFPAIGTKKQRLCVSCGVHVELSSATYHGHCKTVRWLETYCRFKYDKTDQCLTESKEIYLQAANRRLLIEILKAHAQLKRDIVTRSGTQTNIWKRDKDGRLTKVNIRTQQETELVGSYAWRKAHGLIPS